MDFYVKNVPVPTIFHKKKRKILWEMIRTGIG